MSDMFGVRVKRDVVDDEAANSTTHKVATAIRSIGYKLKHNVDTPRATFGLKMFGNDILYRTIDGTDEFWGAVKALSLKEKMRYFFSGKEINYTKSGVFLDVSYEVPMLCGLPLSIHAFGASSIDLRMSGAIKKLDGKSMDIAGKLKPSVSVDVIATMQADYFHGSSGVRVKGNFYSSTSIDAKVNVDKWKFGKLQFSLPQDRNDIFSARSELYVLKHDDDLPQPGISKRYTNSSCTWPFIDQAVGLQICTEYSMPDVNNVSAMAAPYPSLLLSGPVSFNIHLDKADLTAKTFLFEYHWDEQSDAARGSLSFHTPDSVIPRVFTANMSMTPVNYKIAMAFQNGPLLYTAVGSVLNTTDEKKFDISLKMGEVEKFALDMGYNRTEVRYGWVYYPHILMAVDRKNISGLSGTVKVTEKRNIITYDVNLRFETQRVQTNVSGSITQTTASTFSKMNVNYHVRYHFNNFK